MSTLDSLCLSSFASLNTPFLYIVIIYFQIILWYMKLSYISMFYTKANPISWENVFIRWWFCINSYNVICIMFCVRNTISRKKVGITQPFGWRQSLFLTSSVTRKQPFQSAKVQTVCQTEVVIIEIGNKSLRWSEQRLSWNSGLTNYLSCQKMTCICY